MGTISTERPQTATRGQELERFETGECVEGATEQLWQEVQDEIQQVLAELDDGVRQHVPDLETQVGKTQARHFSLFAYRTFSRTGKAVDPVVVGLTFLQSREADEDRVVVEADISGEETGDILVSVPPRTIPLVPVQLIHTAREMAAQLVRNSRRIADALLDPSREVG